MSSKKQYVLIVDVCNIFEKKRFFIYFYLQLITGTRLRKDRAIFFFLVFIVFHSYPFLFCFFFSSFSNIFIKHTPHCTTVYRKQIKSYNNYKEFKYFCLVRIDLKITVRHIMFNENCCFSNTY